MYLARLKEKQNSCRYVIRQSYAEGNFYKSRDLFDLGEDPSQFIIYPGGNGFYIDPVVEDAIAALGTFVSQDDLEPVFYPFLYPHIRKVIDGFDQKRHANKVDDDCYPSDSYHLFDRYRLHYLKMGQVNSRALNCVPDRFYAGLRHKSRDQIEYDFITAETILKPFELSRYTFQIFDLQQHFDSGFARSHPELLDQQRMDRFFVKTLCDLNRDEAFWTDKRTGSILHHHLIRYVVMYFDNYYLPLDPFRSFLREFMNRHRIHRPPRSVEVSFAESAQLFGVTVDVLKKMDGLALTRKYRKLAMKHHPDRGGDPETFVKLSEAYEKVMKGKSRN